MDDPTKKQMEDREKEIREDRDPLEEDERAVELIGEEFREVQMEDAETASGEEHDIMEDLPESPDAAALPSIDNVPEGMEATERGVESDSDSVHVAGEDEETGDPDGHHKHIKGTSIP